MRPEHFHSAMVLLTAALALVGLHAGCARMVTLSEPDSPGYMDAMAEATRHEHHGRLEEAERAYARAVKLARRRVDQDEARYRRANILEELGQHEQALRLFDAIAVREPPSRRTARATFDAALLREQLGRREKAMAGFREVVREHPDSGLGGRALWYLVKDRRDRGDDAGALAMLRPLYPRLRETTLGDDVLHHRAIILLDRGDREGARRALERIVDEHPYPQGHRWDDALMKLADLAEEDGQLLRAAGYMRALVRPHETTSMVGSYTLPNMPKAQLRMARLYRRAGAHEEAASAYRELGDEFPRSILRDDALYELGDMRFEQGRRQEACELFREVTEEFEVGHARREAADRLARDCRGG